MPANAMNPPTLILPIEVKQQKEMEALEHLSMQVMSLSGQLQQALKQIAADRAETYRILALLAEGVHTVEKRVEYVQKAIDAMADEQKARLNRGRIDAVALDKMRRKIRKLPRGTA